MQIKRACFCVAKAGASETLLCRPLVGRPVTYTFIRNFVPVSLSLLNPLNPLLGSTTQNQGGGSFSEANLPERRNFRSFLLRKSGRKCTVYSLLAERSSVGSPSASLEFNPFSLMRSRTNCSAKRKFGLNSPSALCTALRATPFGYGLLYY
jgi:hypothetical protein